MAANKPVPFIGQPAPAFTGKGWWRCRVMFDRFACMCCKSYCMHSYIDGHSKIDMRL